MGSLELRNNDIYLYCSRVLLNTQEKAHHTLCLTPGKFCLNTGQDGRNGTNTNLWTTFANTLEKKLPYTLHGWVSVLLKFCLNFFRISKQCQILAKQFQFLQFILHSAPFLCTAHRYLCKPVIHTPSLLIYSFRTQLKFYLY